MGLRGIELGATEQPVQLARIAHVFSSHVGCSTAKRRQ